MITVNSIGAQRLFDHPVYALYCMAYMKHYISAFYFNILIYVLRISYYILL